MAALENIAIITLVRSHLLDDKRLAGQPIDVTCSEGYIQLLGWVDSDDKRQLAVMLAKGIVGVRNVEDRIQIRRLQQFKLLESG
jgi:hyperosmotically inducible protein